MDIFTTQLRRVVQTPIKPSNAKIKALSKESGNHTLTEDFDHLEYHEKYVVNDAEQEQSEHPSGSEKNTQQATFSEPEENNKKPNTDSSKTELPHLDIYV